MLMIFPEPCLSMCRPACCVRRKTLVRFTSITASQSSSEYSAAGARRIMPALLTRISIVPKCRTASSTRRAQTAASPTSPTSAIAFAPAASILCCVALGAVPDPCTTTSAPACARAMAMAAPKPRDEPVTRAVLPLRLNLSRIIFLKGQISGFRARRSRECDPRPLRLHPYYVRPWRVVVTVCASAPSEQSAHLALHYFHVGFALEARANHALAIDKKRERQAQDASVAQAEVRIAHGYGIIEFEPLDQLARHRGIVVHRDANNLQSLRPILPLPCGEDRHLHLAGRAPCGPEIEQHDLAAKASEM